MTILKIKLKALISKVLYKFQKSFSECIRKIHSQVHMALFSSYGKNVYEASQSASSSSGIVNTTFATKQRQVIKSSPIKKVVFGMLTASDIRKLSVCEVYRPSQRNTSGGDPVGTPYDRRMGVLESGHICETCGYDNKNCLGHLGHINLPIPIYNIIFIDWISRILQCVCVACARPRILPENMKMMGIRGVGISRLKCIALRAEKYTTCPWEDCKKNLFSFRVEEQERITRTWSSLTSKEVSSIDFSAGEALNVFMRMTDETCYQIGLNYGLPSDPIHKDATKSNALQFRPEALIFTALPVIPPISRPYIIQDRKQHDDDLTDKYNSIAKECEKLSPHPNIKKPENSRRQPLTETKRCKIEASLRSHVWTLIHNKKDKSKVSAGGRPHKGLRERITGKDGRVQFNVRGKRVDFSARTVIIGGGTLIRADEIGVPEYIAKILTESCVVTKYNLEHMQKLVSEKKVNKIIRRGVTRNLSSMPDKGCKMRLFPGDVIEVHLYDGFPVVANRQPTLRLESMIGFKIRIIDCFPMRLPVCFTTGLNADFDGDEMNIHIPQSIGAKTEVAVILRAANQILSPQRNAPVNGIVQDGLVGCYLLTNIWDDTNTCTTVPVDIYYMCIDNSKIPRARVSNLLKRAYRWYPEFIAESDGYYAFVSDDIEIPGTLFLSILFPPDLKYEKVTDENPKYPMVKIEEGVILPGSGPICKKVVGARAGSYLHEVAIRCPDMAIEFLTECQFLVDHWLYTHGFSIGVSDLFLSGDADETISNALIETEIKVGDILDRCPNGIPDDAAEQEINGLLNSTMNVGLRLSKNNMSKGDRNALNVMRKAGAKGNLTNLVQTTAFVGQQNVNGKRIQPLLCGGTRTLPYFEEYDNSSRARGFVGCGYRDGLDPIQMFFHAMGGRQGIIATAVGTAVTGYIQKRIGRKMEDNIVHEDCSVRINPSTKEEIVDLSKPPDENNIVLKGGKIIQFIYGGDGFDARKLCYAKGINFPFFCNPVSVASRMNNSYRQNTGDYDAKERKLDNEEIDLITSYITVGYHNHVKKLSPSLKRATANIRHALSKACKFVTIIEECIPEFCEELRNIFEKSKCQVGDKVGLVASSSVSEPATQMMLDTFHLAGVGTSDRGGGVPRLDELIGATKSDKQKKTTGTLYLSNNEITELTNVITEIKKSGVGNERLKKLREERLCIGTILKKTYEEVKVGDLIKSYSLGWIDKDVIDGSCFSPIEESLKDDLVIGGYEKYKPEWWGDTTLNSCDIYDMGNYFQWWVVRVQFDVGKLYERRMSLKDIKCVIEETHSELRCVCSPDIIGKMDIFCDYTTAIESFNNLSTEFFQLSPGEKRIRESHITQSNLPYFICRDIVVNVVKNTKISGIEGVKKAHVREDLESGSICIDVDLQPKSTVISKKRFVTMLSDPHADASKTVVDDMHTIASVLGIEAARKMIIEEDTRIISFNGTYINPRHIQLLVDNMTYTGEITSVRRDGISRDVGPIAKLMFEQPVTNAITAAVSTEQDSVRSVASAIMMGVLSSGTGSVITK